MNRQTSDKHIKNDYEIKGITSDSRYNIRQTHSTQILTMGVCVGLPASLEYPSKKKFNNKGVVFLIRNMKLRVSKFYLM